MTPLAGGLALLASAPLVARRRSPLRVLAVVVPLLLAYLAVFHPNQAAVGVMMLLVFTIEEQGDRLRSLVVGALMAPVVTAAVLLTAQHGTVSDVVGCSALVIAALAAGAALPRPARLAAGPSRRSRALEKRLPHLALEERAEAYGGIGNGPDNGAGKRTRCSFSLWSS